MRAVKSVTSTVKPSGTRPPALSNSVTEKSTLKLAQQAPQVVQRDMVGRMVDLCARSLDELSHDRRICVIAK